MSGRENSMSTVGLSEEYLARRAELPVCVVCERPMRPAKSREGDWPATVAFATTDQCKTCYNRKYLKAQSANATVRVEGRKARRNGQLVEKKVLVFPRAEVAKRWSAEARSAALVVCGNSANAEEAAETLSMLGLFDTDPVAGYGYSYAPKGLSA